MLNISLILCNKKKVYSLIQIIKVFLKLTFYHLVHIHQYLYSNIGKKHYLFPKFIKYSFYLDHKEIKKRY